MDTTVPTVDALVALVSIDLVRASYRSDDFPAETTEAERRRSAARYEKFLSLSQRFPGERLAPTRDIDRFWHLHMLSPVAYYRDCMRAFGRLMDHDGGFGKADEEVAELQAVFARTAELWEATYAEPYLADGTWLRDVEITKCWHDCSGRCWHACANVEAMNDAR